VKYAAKRTWPEKPKAWEFKGEADTAEDFAVDFASTQDLRLGTQIVVIEREGEDPELRFFKVANTSPYQLVTAEAGAGGPSQAPAHDLTTMPESTYSDSTDDTEAVALPSLRPFSSMILYMAKVGLFAVVVIGALGFLIKYLRESV
jgi:hypothetical protein